jgi:hypothetical protein
MTDPVIDAAFPPLGPCGLCGSGLDQRHRMLDAIAGAVAAGEDEGVVADDYGTTVEVVRAVASSRPYWDEALAGDPR